MPSAAEASRIVNQARTKAKKQILAKYAAEIDALIDLELADKGYKKTVKTVWVASNGDA